MCKSARLTHNPVAKHMHKANCRGFVVPSKRSKQKDIETYRDALENALQDEIDGVYLTSNDGEEE